MLAAWVTTQRQTAGAAAFSWPNRGVSRVRQRAAGRDTQRVPICGFRGVCRAKDQDKTSLTSPCLYDARGASPEGPRPKSPAKRNVRCARRPARWHLVPVAVRRLGAPTGAAILFVRKSIQSGEVERREHERQLSRRHEH
jgi:hypothetical protein